MNEHFKPVGPRWTYKIPLKPRSKARPQRAAAGFMYMPKGYQEYKKQVREAILSLGPCDPLLSPLVVTVQFHQPTQPRGDMDNLAGSILDAIQPERAKGNVKKQREYEASSDLAERLRRSPGALIGDDSQVVRLVSEWVPSWDKHILLTLQEVEVVIPVKPSKRKEKAA